MPRPPRIFFAGAVHHIVARGNNKMDLFRDNHDFRIYRKLWVIAKSRFNLKIRRWTFMTNHIHLLIEQIEDAGVAEAMHFIQGRYARYFGKKYLWKGHVWESRYTNRLIVDDRYYARCAQYIEENPVKAGLVAQADAYPWSSAAFYSRQHRDPLTDEEGGSQEKGNNEGTGPDRLFIGRRAVGSIRQLRELSQKTGKQLLLKPRRSVYQE